MSQSQTDSESETEFLTEDVPVVKRTANLKGRRESLAKARETKVRKQKVVKNVMEVHKEINKAKALTQRAATSMSKATSRAEAEGIHIPTVNEPSETHALMEMMRSMANEIKTLRAPPPAPAPALVPDPELPVPENPKAKPKPKPKPKPKTPVPEPEPEPVPVMSPYHEKMVRLDALRRALGRK